MAAARVVLAMAGTAVLLLAACGGSERMPHLMNLRSASNGPDEFAVLPAKPLEMPEDLAALPEPTPGGTNLTDPDPFGDAIAALGGKPRPKAEGAPVPATDGALYTYASRYGVSADIRKVLANEDLDWRRRHDGRLLERLFDVNVYFKAYRDMMLDQHAELLRWRLAGARTPSAPPRSPKE